MRGNLPVFIKNFLSGQNFKVRIDSTLSERRAQDTGVSRGSTLSVTLFSLKINCIILTLSPSIDKSLYGDCFLISFRSESMNTSEGQLQLNLNKIENLANENCFKFSHLKTLCVHFCHRRGLHANPDVKINNRGIPAVEKNKFLALILSRNCILRNKLSICWRTVLCQWI